MALAGQATGEPMVHAIKAMLGQLSFEELYSREKALGPLEPLQSLHGIPRGSAPQASVAVA